MSEKYVNIDEKWFPEKLREYADKLDENFYDNIIDVLEHLKFQMSSVVAKINRLQQEMQQKHLKEYMETRKKEK